MDDAPTWLVYEDMDHGMMWCRVPEGADVSDVVKAESIAGGHTDPGALLDWLKGEAPDPWAGGDGQDDGGVLDRFGRRLGSSVDLATCLDTKADTQVRQRLVLVLATFTAGTVTIFGLWWDAKVAPSLDTSTAGHHLGSFVLKLGVLSLTLLLGGLVPAFVRKPWAEKVATKLGGASLLVSTLSLLGVIFWLLAQHEDAQAFWQSF